MPVLFNNRPRTRIVATIGPASDSPDTLDAMIRAGMDCARITVAHNTVDVGLARMFAVREAAARVGVPVGCLIDLPGPKLRAGNFHSPATLVAGSTVTIRPGTGPSNADTITIDNAATVALLEVGDRIVLGDGAISLEVTGRHDGAPEARVTHGGLVSGRPGIILPSGRTPLRAPTPEDLDVLDAFVSEGVDAVAVSFVRSASDLRRLGVEAPPRGPLVIAKIETAAAVASLQSIAAGAGALMVARGDLGMELSLEDVPHVQSDLIAMARSYGRPVITATQMLESMTHAPTPTRAEVADVTTAVLSGTSALMLSGETAVGINPVEAVATMARIAMRAESDPRMQRGVTSRAPSQLPSADAGHDMVTDALALAAVRAADEVDATAIICVSRTGFTARDLARFRPRQRIIAATPSERSLHQMCLTWGTTPVLLPPDLPSDEPDAALRVAVTAGAVKPGDRAVLLFGSDNHNRIRTDSMRVVTATD